MQKELLAYISGFLDGDGCLMAQIIHRKDYRNGYQIRLSIVFYQKTIHKEHLVWLKTKLKEGYIRDRKDDMSEYTIVGIEKVILILRKLIPYLRLKQDQARLVLKIGKIPKNPDPKTFLKFCSLVDQSAKYNYSKKRKVYMANVKRDFEKHKIFPRND